MKFHIFHDWDTWFEVDRIKNKPIVSNNDNDSLDQALNTYIPSTSFF